MGVHNLIRWSVWGREFVVGLETLYLASYIILVERVNHLQLLFNTSDGRWHRGHGESLAVHMFVRCRLRISV